ncbi:MAG TPA: carbon starvation protein A [Methanocorpusculum sp.]|nr:carbon starvation protein A [Methanocorpusculum sp.]
MITFFAALTLLILGYFTYGKLAEKVLKPTDAPTPAKTMADGIDYVEMPTWKVFLIQLLNIAGTGPIFGALMGAVFGPVVFLWIVFGCILGGAVHDYCTGMISIRMGGATISDIVGKYLGGAAKKIMIVFSVVLLILVGTVFVTSPAALISLLTPEQFGFQFWIAVILIYYIIATLLPIDKVIGKLYPIFGVILILMVVLIGGGIIVMGYTIPELTFQNFHPDGIPIWPYMFITVACGAVSGFHATQSPLMARCLKTEKDGRKVFYGAMITEGIIALIWAAAGCAFYGSSSGLQTALTTMGQSGVVYDISTNLLGIAGGVLAIIGVVVCPITSGDTAFRSARLTLADTFHLDQSKISKRLLLTIPLLAAGAILTQLNFDVLWRYFSWSNQTLAMIALWAAAVYIRKEFGRTQSLIAAIPALFMSGVSSTYILMADEGLMLPETIAYPIGIIFAIACGILFMALCFLKRNEDMPCGAEKENKTV